MERRPATIPRSTERYRLWRGTEEGEREEEEGRERRELSPAPPMARLHCSLLPHKHPQDNQQAFVYELSVQEVSMSLAVMLQMRVVALHDKSVMWFMMIVL